MTAASKREVPVWLSLFTFPAVVAGVAAYAIGPGHWNNLAVWGSFLSALPAGISVWFADSSGLSAFVGPVLVGVSYLCFMLLFLAFFGAYTWTRYYGLCLGLAVLLLLNVPGSRPAAKSQRHWGQNSKPRQTVVGAIPGR